MPFVKSKTMKSTSNLSVNLTRTLLLILGIVVALLLSINSGLFGEVTSFLTSFQIFTAETQEDLQPDRLEQFKQVVAIGQNIYQEINQILKSI